MERFMCGITHKEGMAFWLLSMVVAVAVVVVVAVAVAVGVLVS